MKGETGETAERERLLITFYVYGLSNMRVTSMNAANAATTTTGATTSSFRSKLTSRKTQPHVYRSLLSTIGKSRMHNRRSSTSDVVRAVSSDTEELYTVRFCCKAKCPFGAGVVVVGTGPSLGDWNPKEGLQLEWHDGHLWFAEAAMPSGSNLDFKFVKTHRDKGDIIEWQEGENISLIVENDAEIMVGDIGKALSDEENEEAFGKSMKIRCLIIS